jgi:hypothetical protein
MKMLVSALTVLGAISFLPQSALAADLDDYGYEEGAVVSERVPIIEEERIIERRYYPAPPVVGYYEERFHPLPYYARDRDYDWERDVRWTPEWHGDW